MPLFSVLLTGRYLGFKQPYEWPIKHSKIPRMIPQKSCFLSLPTLACFSGITLYSMTFIQVFSIVQVTQDTLFHSPFILFLISHLLSLSLHSL